MIMELELIRDALLHTGLWIYSEFYVYCFDSGVELDFNVITRARWIMNFADF